MWPTRGGPVPVSFELFSDEILDDWVLERVVLGPIDAEELILPEQFHHSGEAFVQPETLVLLGTHFPGVDGQQLEGIVRGQRGPGAPGFHVLLKETGETPRSFWMDQKLENPTSCLSSATYWLCNLGQSLSLWPYVVSLFKN